MGCFVKPDPSIAESAALAGWNVIVFDAEHGTIEPGDCENLVRAVELRGVTPMARVTANRSHIILSSFVT